MPRATSPKPLIRPGMTRGHLLFHHWLVEEYGAQRSAADRPRYKAAPDGRRGIIGFTEDINRLLRLKQLDHFCIQPAWVYLWLVQTQAARPRCPNSSAQELIQQLSDGRVPARSWATPLKKEHLE